MKRFRDLSSLLDKPPASHSDGTPGVDAEAEETRYRRLVENWNGTVEEIRKIEGFSRCLFPPLFSDLQDASSCYTIDGSRDQRPSRESRALGMPLAMSDIVHNIKLFSLKEKVPRDPTSLLEQFIAVISG
ncbi:hypothetical protein EV424DRAFT_1540380 [Suillus variegatus]|nr:hypothetical protein EV424DRAFT_1540380 [Suillus variegatus]